MNLKEKINSKASSVLILVIFLVVMYFLVKNHYHKNTILNSKISTQEKSQSVWEGDWILNDSNNFNYSEIKIKHSDIDPNSFIFNIDAQNGANSGTWSNEEDGKVTGTLIVKGVVATYSDELEKQDDGTMAPICTATFKLSTDEKTLSLDTNCDQLYAGYGVYFGGDYQKDNKIKNVALQDVDIFKNNSSAYTAFNSLVGDYAKNFTGTLMLQNDEKDLDGFKASVVSLAVGHAYTELESIIMVTPDNKIWAATIDWDDVKKESVIRYFTNVSQWKKRLPKTIDSWRTGFKDYKVIYE